MGRRFSRLEAEVLSILKAGGDPNSSSDEAIKKYWAWKTYKDKNQHERPSGSTRQTEGQVFVAVLPFALTGTDLHAAELSKRAYKANPISNKKTEFNWKSGNSNNTTPVDYRRGFEPAKAVIRAKGAESSEVSKITGRKYKTKSGSTQQGFVYPFGRNSSQTEGQVQASILEAVKATHSVSFKPEVYRVVEVLDGTEAP